MSANKEFNLLWWVIPGALAGMPMPYIHPDRRMNGGGALEAHVDDLPELYLAGIRAGDLITEFNGVAVRTTGEFNRLIRAAKPRTKATITFYRGNVLQKVELTLGYRT